MNEPKVVSKRIEQSFSVNFSYPVCFTKNAFNPKNNLLAGIFPSDTKPTLIAIVDSNLLSVRPTLISEINQYSEAHGLHLKHIAATPGGEICKNSLRYVEEIYQLVLEHAIDRHSYILAIGGGAVLDMVGFAASTAHRGIRLIRMPTTVLGQNDAGIGVKNAVNFSHRKNFIGNFSAPYAVINDIDFIWTLEDRDLRAGIAETIKVSLIKDAKLFDHIHQNREALKDFEKECMEMVILEGARLHLEHIQNNGDPFESGSSRPLDFGHWSAHKLEELSDHQIRHGEAVAIGILMDATYSHLTGLLSQQELGKITDIFLTLGYPIPCKLLEELDIEKSLEEFREHLGGKLTIAMIAGIGNGIDVNHVDADIMNKSRATLLEIAYHIKDIKTRNDQISRANSST